MGKKTQNTLQKQHPESICFLKCFLLLSFNRRKYQPFFISLRTGCIFRIVQLLGVALSHYLVPLPSYFALLLAIKKKKITEHANVEDSWHCRQHI